MHRILRILSVALLAVGSLMAAGQDGPIFASLFSGKALPGTPKDTHASTLVELKNGDVLAAWFGGTWEGDKDVEIYTAQLHAGTWSTPRVVASARPVACWNPVLFHSNDGRLWLYYKTGESPTTWKGVRRWSDDEGKSWSEAERLPDGVIGPIKDKPLVLPNGVIVSGSSVEGEQWSVRIERSTDNGKSWTVSAPIVLAEAVDVPNEGALQAAKEGKQILKDEDAGVQTKIYPPAERTVGIIQPSIVSLGGGHLRFYARSKSRAARIACSDSTDEGKSWSSPKLLDLPNPNSGIDAVGLKDGRVVLIFNNSYNRRSPLNLAVSNDGEHFKVFKNLAEGPGQYSYPAIIQAANGDLLLTYSWRRQTIAFARIPLAEVPR